MSPTDLWTLLLSDDPDELDGALAAVADEKVAAEPAQAAGAAADGRVSTEERLRVARWMLERAEAQPGVDDARAATTVAALLDLDVEALRSLGPVRRRRELEVTR